MIAFLFIFFRLSLYLWKHLTIILDLKWELTRLLFIVLRLLFTLLFIELAYALEHSSDAFLFAANSLTGSKFDLLTISQLLHVENHVLHHVVAKANKVTSYAKTH